MANERAVIFIATLFANLAFICALPADPIPPGELPFLQFTDGGVRVNFGGYHAEAGLGGLLGGSRTGGGLHASAGTPFGANAAAGLGGILNGNNANTGGGLYARAGLGNGRPEARAGLGGVLDGSGRSNHPIAGGLYAGASTGQVSTGVERSGVLLSANKRDESAAEASKKSPNRHTNIQIIAKSKNHKEEREVANSEVSSSNSAFFPPSNQDSSVSGSKSTEKNGNVDEKLATPPSGSSTSTEDENLNTVYRKGRPYPRRFYRKRLRAVPHKKVTYIASSVTDSQNTPAASNAFEGGVYSRVNTEGESDDGVAVIKTKNQKDETLFDDIFNIPISTLTAVNQLLRNNAG